MDVIVYAYVEEDQSAADQPTTPTGEAQHEPPQQQAPSQRPRPRYTKGILRQTLQLMGCKPRLAHRAAEKAFHVLQQRASLRGRGQQWFSSVERLRPGFACVALPRSQFRRLVADCLRAADDDEGLLQQHMEDFGVACR